MSLKRFILSSAACLWAVPAFADLSARDVWADWQSYAQTFGFAITGTETSVPGGLVVENVSIGSDLDDRSALDMAFASVRFSETDAGAVRITLPDEFVMRTKASLPDGTTRNAQMTYSHVALETLVTGDPANLVYSFSADSLSGISTTTLQGPGGAAGVPGATVRFSVADLAGDNTVNVGQTRTLRQTGTAASLSYDIDYTDPQSGARAILTGLAEDIEMTGESVLPLLVMQQMDLGGLLGAGFSSTGAFQVGPNSVEVNLTGPEGPLDARFTSQEATISTGMGAEGLSYKVVQDDVTADIAGDILPLPLSLTLEQSSVTFAVPLLPADASQPFSLGFAIEGVTFPEALWQIFDPGGALSRDPATVALALGGTARLDQPLFAPDATGPVPGVETTDIETLTIDRLNVEIAGAQLTGTGSFTLPDSGAPAVPAAPEGIADFTLTGANTLLDTLVGMGLLTQQDATGARMMMGLMARPGDGPDTLVSRIEITEGFEIYANGQRIR